MEDLDLIRQAQKGDGAAVRTLYQRHASRVYSVIRRLAGDDALAEDWAQEAWIRAFRALPTFRGQSQFTTWIHRIAVNSALQGRRTRERRTCREAVLDEASGGAAVEGQPLLRVRLERSMAKLPEGMRRVLVLHDVEGYTHEEIGEMLGVAPGTCKSQLFKARAKMRVMLRGELEPVPETETCTT